MREFGHTINKKYTQGVALSSKKGTDSGHRAKRDSNKIETTWLIWQPNRQQGIWGRLRSRVFRSILQIIKSFSRLFRLTNQRLKTFEPSFAPLENWKFEEWGCWVDQDVVRHLKSETFPTWNTTIWRWLYIFFCSELMFILIIRGRICFHFRRDFINGEENQALSTHLQYSSNCGPNAHHDLYHYGQGMKNLVVPYKIKKIYNAI